MCIFQVYICIWKGWNCYLFASGEGENQICMMGKWLKCCDLNTGCPNWRTTEQNSSEPQCWGEQSTTAPIFLHQCSQLKAHIYSTSPLSQVRFHLKGDTKVSRSLGHWDLNPDETINKSQGWDQTNSTKAMQKVAQLLCTSGFLPFFKQRHEAVVQRYPR